MNEDIKQALIQHLNNLDFLDDYEYQGFSPENIEECLNKNWVTRKIEVSALEEFRNFLLKNSLVVNHVEQVGGMDQGSHYYVIWECDGHYFRNITHYASHYGISDWFGVKEVFPHTKQVTYYKTN